MNERIKQLAEQAGLKMCSCGCDMPTRQSAKFAEMIVKECADILMKPEYAMNHPEELADYNKGWVNGRLIGIEHIKEHFGVKE